MASQPFKILLVSTKLKSSALPKKTTGLSADSLTGIRDSASYTVIAEDALEGVYWLGEATPYAARYGIEKDAWGVEAWVTELKSMTAFSGVLSVKDLVQHIVTHTKEFYKGNEH